MKREAYEDLSEEKMDCRDQLTTRVFRDPRPLNEQLACFAERGAIAPESLSLGEIRMICEAFNRGGMALIGQASQPSAATFIGRDI